MQHDFYIVISYDTEHLVLGLGLYDLKKERFYCGNNAIGEDFDDNYYLDLDSETSFCLAINRNQFLKFKKLNFEKQIKMKKLTDILIVIGLEEHAV